LVKLGESLKRGVRGKGTITLASTLLFAIILVALHVIEPETNFSPISLYSLGPFGIVMRTGFIVLGLAFFSMVTGLLSRARPTALYRADLILLVIAGAGLITIGVFNTDAPRTAPTFSGLIHSLAANIWSISALVGILLFAVAFRQDGRSLAIGRLSRNLGIAVMITYFGGFLDLGTYYIAVQPRVFFALVVLWMSFIANQLRSGKLTNVAVIHGND
jgi:Protein of unknown function (DUF998)